MGVERWKEAILVELVVFLSSIALLRANLPVTGTGENLETVRRGPLSSCCYYCVVSLRFCFAKPGVSGTFYEANEAERGTSSRALA